jgi:hypothetical protein
MRGDLAVPRACWTRGRLRDEVRDDYMLVDVEPPVIGQNYGLGGEDITSMLISTRHRGFTLFPITEWPSHVYITRILDLSIVTTLFFTGCQVELIGWGMIFRTENEAKAGAGKVVR